ncbi:hypothetical protein ZWY2020_020305 [Hordeum vulgare]|nr:hypothetical protein ZWY2020_020305 [Hordeum vulgare]
MSGFLRRPLVVCAVVCAATRSGLPRLGTPGSSPSLSSTPADANCVSVSLSMLPVAAMRSSVGADVVLVFSPASRAHCRPAHCRIPEPPSLNGTMMNSTQEERDDAHDSFLQVKKGSILVTRMERITTYKNQHRQPRSGKKTKHVQRLKTKRLKLKVHFQMSKDTIFSRPHTKALCNASHRSLVEQARATAAFQQRNSELSHQVNDLQDQLQAERANTQEIINLERAEREQLEGKLKEERAERERLLEAERTSRLKFEKNMMAKFAEFSKQMGTQQVQYSDRVTFFRVQRSKIVLICKDKDHLDQRKRSISSTGRGAAAASSSGTMGGQQILLSEK